MNAYLISAPYDAVGLGGGLYLVHGQNTRGAHLLPAEQLRMLESCGEAATLSEHVNRISSDPRNSSSSGSAVNCQLEELLSRGLLMRLEDLMTPSDVKKKEHQDISCFALVTSDRPRALERALNTYAKNFAKHANDVEVIVVDDGTAEVSRCLAAYATNMGGKHGNLMYGGVRQKRLFIQELACHGIDPEVAGFGLLGVVNELRFRAPGANRNAVILDSVDRNVLMVDDDTECRLAVHSDHKGAVEFSGHADPRHVSFFQNRDEVLANAKWVSDDFIGAHSKILGRKIGDLVDLSALGKKTFNRPCKHIKDALLNGKGIVKVTMSGVAGDCGAYSPQRFLTANQTVRQVLQADQTLFETAFKSREVVAVAECYVVTHYSFCHSTSLGVANTDFLPPFVPIGGNEDGSFGMLVSLLCNGAFWGHVPLAIYHNPLVPNGNMSATAAGSTVARPYCQTSQFRISDLIISLLSDADIGRVERGSDGLKRLGTYFGDITKDGVEDFWQRVTIAVRRNEAELFRRLATINPKTREMPGYWSVAVDRMQDEIRARLLMRSCPLPAEIGVTGSTDEGREVVRGVIALLGRLFCAWPDMLEATRYLSLSGKRLSIPGV